MGKVRGSFNPFDAAAVLIAVTALLALIASGCRPAQARSSWATVDVLYRSDGYMAATVFYHKASGQCVVVGLEGGVETLRPEACQ
jgi:hypothetical protein